MVLLSWSAPRHCLPSLGTGSAVHGSQGLSGDGILAQAILSPKRLAKVPL
jgi:hypothetical protein